MTVHRARHRPSRGIPRHVGVDGAGHWRRPIVAGGSSSVSVLPAWGSRPSPLGTGSRPRSARIGTDQLPLCSTLHRSTCLIDGDTGRDGGRKWRLISIDTPELSAAGCDNERRLAEEARQRLQQLMAGGYRIRPNGKIDPHGRTLVDIELPDGRDVSRILLDEGWPSAGPIGATCGARARRPRTRRPASGDRGINSIASIVRTSTMRPSNDHRPT